MKTLTEYISRIPSVSTDIVSEIKDDFWWVKFQISIDHQLSWRVIQELGHVLNYLSVEDRLGTKFYPVSPPPYMNGGPSIYLSWIIENTDKHFTPKLTRDWLASRLPDPTNDENEWHLDDE